MDCQLKTISWAKLKVNLKLVQPVVRRFRHQHSNDSGLYLNGNFAHGECFQFGLSLTNYINHKYVIIISITDTLIREINS